MQNLVNAHVQLLRTKYKKTDGAHTVCVYYSDDNICITLYTDPCVHIKTEGYFGLKCVYADNRVWNLRIHKQIMT